MAESSSAKKRIIKKSETVRERTEKSTAGKPKQRRLRQTAGSAVKPFKVARKLGQKSYYLPLPDNRFWKFMNKRRRVIPRFFREAFQELRLVTWPGRKETWKLTTAVFVFAIVFGIAIAITDYGLDKLFRNIILK